MKRLFDEIEETIIDLLLPERLIDTFPHWMC